MVSMNHMEESVPVLLEHGAAAYNNILTEMFMYLMYKVTQAWAISFICGSTNSVKAYGDAGDYPFLNMEHGTKMDVLQHPYTEDSVTITCSRFDGR